jgi:hypothetical protein
MVVVMMFNKGRGRLPQTVNESTTNELQKKEKEGQLKKRKKLRRRTI